MTSASETRCCVVGGGPGGMVLAYMLARRGIPVTLLEAHHDFDRDFRGDTLHPSIMEILDQLGLADRLLQLPHGTMRGGMLMTGGGPFQPLDLSRLKTRFPFIVMMPQVDFLDFMATEAAKYPTFDLRLGAAAFELIQENGIVRGVRYHDADRNVHEMRALLTVGADGRFSKVRRLAGLELIETAPPMDVLWFRLPRRDGDITDAATGSIGGGKMLIMLSRRDDWQIGYVIQKGGYQKIKAEGLAAMRHSLVELAPWLGDRVEVLREWKQIALLSVASSRLRRWYRPGLLMIGDAAHVMSPVGGVGINYAVMDAVAAANVLGGPLEVRRLATRHLAEVQRQRSFPTRFIQKFQGFMQRNVVSQALSTRGGFRVPWLVRMLMKMPFLRSLPARLVGFGINRPKVEEIWKYK